MPIKNLTKNTIIATDYKHCTSFWEQAIGLMFTRTMKQPLVFVFDRPQRVHLHMWFVFYPIDVLWLDEEMHVVQMVENLRPFMLVFSLKRSICVVELPNGVIKSSKTAVGDRIEIAN